MFEKLIEYIPEKWLNFFIKVILVASVAVSIKIAIQMKKEKVSLVNVILSFIIGVGFAALTGNLILEKFSPSTAPICIGVITIMGEKIGTWLVYKLNVDVLMQDFVDYLTRKYKK
jgi:hypothetical protein